MDEHELHSLKVMLRFALPRTIEPDAGAHNGKMGRFGNVPCARP